MKNLLTKFKNISRRTALVVTAGMVMALSGTAFADWGPTRGLYDYNDPAQRVGSMNGPVLNSFINTPSYGDERNFTRVSPAGTSQWAETANNVQAGQEVEFRVYVHNNANQSTNGSNLDGPGVALDTRVRFAIPTGQANGIDVGGYISASNGKNKDGGAMTQVYDTATVRNDAKAFSLDYVEGSARLYNNGAFSAGMQLPDSIVTASGAQIGWNALDGRLPGCFEFDAVVIIKAKVIAPALEVKKTVSKVAAPTPAQVSESVTAKLGDTITWRIDFKNTGSDAVNAVTIRDSLPAGLTLVPGSITWLDSNHPNGETLQDTALGSGGVNVGTYSANSNGVIRFRTTINKDFKECEIKNVAIGRATNVPDTSDDAKVMIENCQPTKPVTATTTRLPRTGAGDAMGIVAATTIAGALAHRFVYSRKYSA